MKAELLTRIALVVCFSFGISRAVKYEGAEIDPLNVMFEVWAYIATVAAITYAFYVMIAPLVN